MNAVLPTDSAARKATPMARGLLDYFPAALAEVSRLSRAGNEKHNPGQEMHWSRGVSTDHADTIIRHLVDRGTVDPEDGFRHSVKVAWRALALLQTELEEAGAAPGRASRFPELATAEAVEPEPKPCPNLGLNNDGVCDSAAGFCGGYAECLADCQRNGVHDE
jgi:hypothetical protein